MKSRICTKCGVSKPFCEFHRDKKSVSGYKSQCKECRNSLYKRRYRENLEESRARNRKYNKENKERIAEARKKWEKNNKEWFSEYRKNNKETIKMHQKKWRDKNKEADKARKQRWYENNKEHSKQKSLENRRKIRANCTLTRIKDVTRNLIRKSIINGGYSKGTKTERIIGCSFKDFKLYLERKFVERYGLLIKDVEHCELHLDHIIPISLAKDEKRLSELNHFSNLELLFADENEIKADTIDYGRLPKELQ